MKTSKAKRYILVLSCDRQTSTKYVLISSATKCNICSENILPHRSTYGHLFTHFWHLIYSNKRRGAYLIFRGTTAALIRGRRLIKQCTRQIYLFYIFIQRYTFYLLIFLWTDAKLIVNIE